MLRFNVLLLSVSATLFASTASALPQVTAGGGGRATTTAVRGRCSSCSGRDSAMRQRQERLLLRIDSLRWIIDNRRLSDAEREQAAQEIARTVIALQATLDETVRGEVVPPRAAPFPYQGRQPVYQGRQPMIAMVGVEAFQNQGYLGVTFDGPNEDVIRDNERFIRFYRYPKIALVESSSPAERAGVREGDTLLALNGTDVLNETFNLTKLLVPDARIVLRVRREGDNKDLRVIVGKSPDYYAWRARALPRPPVPPIPTQPPARVEVRVAPAPQAEQAPEARVWISNEGVAGAHVATISEGLGKTVGSKEGVLVIQVQPGTPAYNAGLRDGDVILRADGRTVSNVRVLRRVVADGDGNEGVRLVVLRERKHKDLTLRW